MRRYLLPAAISLFTFLSANCQEAVPVIKGTVVDEETRQPLVGAYIQETGANGSGNAVTDKDGRYRLNISVGRKSIIVSYIGYEQVVIRDILVGSGREVIVDISLREKVVTTGDVIVSSSASGRANVNQMATISTTTIRTDDALRFAGGFYDPSRIVNSFAGVVTSNNDYSNDIVIRGNSSRGLLWRLEGVEIPNPNHFSEGQGGSGGAFSAITSNVIANFDFFTGAFPAEFGNAFSGVMDLNLRKGNPDRREYAFQTGMIGAEVAMEGPFKKGSGATYLLNARFTNFSILSDLGLIELGETNYAPRTKDLVFNVTLPLKRAGTFNIFGFFGASALGKIAVHDFTQWTTRDDQWEENENWNTATVGIRNLYMLKNSKTYLRTVVAYTNYSDNYSEGYIDSAYFRNNSYWSDYEYPSLRASVMANHKISSRHTVRIGFDYNFLTANMANVSVGSTGKQDSLVNPYGEASLYQAYAQWKCRLFENLEINTGIHLLYFSLNNNSSIEPRFGLRWQLSPGTAFVAGLGLHSRIESFYVYNSLVKNSSGVREMLNRDLNLAKSFHYVTGFDFVPSKNIHTRIEGYIQNLYDIPIVNNIKSQYSTLNSSERLPDAELENKGTGKNYGLELTIEKSFTKNYYYLLTGSLFNSWYIAGDNKKYNTYYNTGYVSNFLFGKEFYFGQSKSNCIAFNIKWMIRGGYRYTPVDRFRTITLKRIVYQTSSTYGSRLPDFNRLDAGISFKKNHHNYSWIVMLDIQNALDHKNVFRKKFSYSKGKLIETNVLSLGIVPVFNFRIEF